MWSCEIATCVCLRTTGSFVVVSPLIKNDCEFNLYVLVVFSPKPTSNANAVTIDLIHLMEKDDLLYSFSVFVQCHEKLLSKEKNKLTIP
jgi:hypothetical protein